jgi:hypothetical protein
LLLLLLLGSLLAGWLAALFAGPELSAAGGALLLSLFGGAGGGCCAIEAALLASEAVLLSTSAPKKSFPGGWSYRAGLCAAPWKDAFAAASDVTLNTGGLSRWDLPQDQQGPGHPEPQKNIKYINILRFVRIDYGIAAAVPFLPGGKICRLRHVKEASVIA